MRRANSTRPTPPNHFRKWTTVVVAGISFGLIAGFFLGHVLPDARSGNYESNVAQPSASPDRRFVFRSPEMFLRFKCDVHPWMFAYVCVMEHPFFDVSNEDGTYRIPDLPPGEYTMEAVHRKLGHVSRKVRIHEHEQLVLDFEFSSDLNGHTAQVRIPQTNSEQ